MQLSTRKYFFTGKGLTIESKLEWGRRYKGQSPDRADSLIYSYADILGVENKAKASTGKTAAELVKERLKD